MADYSNPKTILSLEVDYTKAIDGINKCREEIDKLKKANEKLLEIQGQEEDEGSAAYKEAANQILINNERIKEYQYSIRSLSKEMQNNARIEKANNEKRSDSINALRASLSIVTRQYDELGRSERESSKGDELRAKINSLTTEIKDLESETQRYYRNVGNYENAIQNALGANSRWFQQLTMIKDITAGGLKQGLQATTTAVTSFGKQLLALLANPVVATLAAIAGAVMLVSKAIKSSEQNTNAWNVILAPFQRILTGVLNVIQNIVTGILSWVKNGAKLVGWIMTMMEKLPIVGNLLKTINGEIRESIAIAQTDAKLAQKRREINEQNARDQKRIAELQKDAATQAHKSRQQQKKDLEEVDRLEKGIAAREVEYARMDYENYKTKSENAQNSAEENDMLSQKYVAMINAETSYLQKTKKVAGQLATAEEAIARERTAAGNAAVNTAQQVEQAKKKELDAVRSAEDALIKLIKDNYERQRKELLVSYDRKIQDLQNRLATEKDLTIGAQNAINAEILTLQKLLQQELDKLNIENLEKRVKQEQERIGLLLEVVEEDYVKRRDLKLQEIDAEEALEESRIAKEIQDEQKRADMLQALHLAMNKKRRDVELEFDKTFQEERVKAIENDFKERIEAAGENELEVLRLQMEEKQKILETAQQMEGESLAKFNERKLGMEKDYQDKKKALAKKEVEIETAKTKAIGAATGALSDLLEEAFEDNRSIAIASKVLALAEIAINSGVAIAAGIKQAMAVKFPANLAAIATTTATILSGITSAIKTVKSAKFAGGGIVTGAGTGTSDSIPARLSNGESVMTAGATSLFSPLLSALNQLGGGVPIIAANPQQTMGEDMLAAAVAKGMALAPRPVVAVTDIAKTQRKVDVIEEISHI